MNGTGYSLLEAKRARIDSWVLGASSAGSSPRISAPLAFSVSVPIWATISRMRVAASAVHTRSRP